MKFKSKSMRERSGKSEKATMVTPGFDQPNTSSATNSNSNGGGSAGGAGSLSRNHSAHDLSALGAASLPIPQTGAEFQDQAQLAQLEADKRAVYKHPLFPLLALLFEKCEMATQSASDTPVSDSFHQDLEAFIQHQERDKKPFLSNDPEVDGLMIKAIQVLRIHLLELDKVQELCKDFCNRYITCLKGKMQSENLLRSDYYDGANGGAHLTSSHSNSPHHSYSSNGDASVSPPNNGIFHPQQQTQIPAHQNVGAGGSLIGPQNYNSVSTSQNHPTSFPVNNVHIMSSSGSMSSHMNTSPDHHTSSSNNSNHSSASAALPLIHGGTPLSQIGAGIPPLGANSCLPSSSQDLFAQSTPPTPSSEDEDDFTGRKKPKRGVLPKHATSIMRSWLFQHIVHPYPTEDEKRQIASQTNLTLLQVNNWFINARRRILQPMLDASNPEAAATPKVKKVKSHSSKPALKYWSDNLANTFNSGQLESTDAVNDIGESSEESEGEGDDGSSNEANDHDLLDDNSDSSQ